MPSIASVSEVELNTFNNGIGTKVIIKGGKLEENSVSSITCGTSISVKNLFFNTPARLKFLKSYYTEFSF